MNERDNYSEFLNLKSQLGTFNGFEPNFIPDYLFDFQGVLLEWAIRKGRDAVFADCGMGKTILQLSWAENVVRETNKRVLILTPLAVSHQTVNEAEKFDIEGHRSNAGELYDGINITNYERLHYFNPKDFIGVVCDESSILKSFDGKRRVEITEFMRKLPYRLLCTATSAPNDYIELGTSSEALGELGHMDMLNRFFKNDRNNSSTGRHYGQVLKWRFKGHAEIPFWRWVASWARALRRPSDLGFDDTDFILPPLVENEHMVDSQKRANGMLFSLPAIGLKEQREERRRTIEDRCIKVAELVSDTGKPALVWCHLNDEGNYLEKIIPDGVQVSGRDSDESKEQKFLDFVSGNIRVLITKPKIGAWGLNFQHCSHVVFFPSHSFEQYYQGVRRCWRFGQKNPVTVDLVTTEGEIGVMKNLQRKAAAADEMFSSLVEEMNRAVAIDTGVKFTEKEEVPTWL
ncbi:MAG: helicase-related protein [Thermodesulfobacteriota bacterium]